MLTSETMNVTSVVSLVTVLRRAAVWVHLAHFENMVDNPISFTMIKIAVMQIIDVLPVADACVTVLCGSHHGQDRGCGGGKFVSPELGLPIM